MKTYRRSLILVAGLLAFEAEAACEMPSLVRTIPEGATATEEELLSAQTEIQAYVAAMDRYIACSNEEIEATGPDATADFLYWMSARVQSARNEVDAVAQKYNEQVKAFRAARQSSALPR